MEKTLCMPELFGSMTGALLPRCCLPTGHLLPACVALYRDSHGGGTRLFSSVFVPDSSNKPEGDTLHDALEADAVSMGSC